VSLFLFFVIIIEVADISGSYIVICQPSKLKIWLQAPTKWFSKKKELDILSWVFLLIIIIVFLLLLRPDDVLVSSARNCKKGKFHSKTKELVQEKIGKLWKMENMIL
jgi:hypothetical protein